MRSWRRGELKSSGGFGSSWRNWKTRTHQALTDEQSTFIEAANRYLNGEISVDEVPLVPVGAPRPDTWDKSMKPSKEQMDWIVGELKKKNGKADDKK